MPSSPCDETHIYFDESIHTRGGFILGAYVCGPDANPPVSSAIERAGLAPGTDEFKSSARMLDHPEQVALREELGQVLASYRIALLVMPSTSRKRLGEEALRGLDQIARANGLSTRTGVTAFLDEGLFSSPCQADEVSKTLGINRYCDLRSEQDSRVAMGIQLADLVAHSAGVMLLETLGLVTKVVKAGAEPGYAVEMEMPIGFELWAQLRSQFFFSGTVENQDPIYRGALVNVGANGLYISPLCSSELRCAAIARFNECYLGCIH